MAYTTQEIKEIVKRSLNASPSADKGDLAHELADSFVPVYNNDIIDEWKAMPSEFDNAWQELGASAKNTITQLMTVDLYLYYLHLTNQAINEIIESDELSLAN